MSETFPHVKIVLLTLAVDADGCNWHMETTADTAVIVGGNKEPYVSVTANMRQAGGRGEMSGCLDEEIVKRHPFLARLIKWHLASEYSGPMHYVANGRYWLGIGEYGEFKLDTFRSHCKIGCVDGDEEKLTALLAALEKLKAEAELVSGPMKEEMRLIVDHNYALWRGELDQERSEKQLPDYTREEKRAALEVATDSKIKLEKMERDQYFPYTDKAKSLADEFLTGRHEAMMQVMYADIREVVKIARALSEDGYRVYVSEYRV